MKNTFFISNSIATIFITILMICLAGFILLGIFGLLDDGTWDMMIFFAPFVILVFFAFVGLSKKGILDRVQITEIGISVKRGMKNEIIFIPWGNVICIEKITNNTGEIIRIDSDIIFEKKPFTLFVENKEKIVELLESYYHE